MNNRKNIFKSVRGEKNDLVFFSCLLSKKMKSSVKSLFLTLMLLLLCKVSSFAQQEAMFSQYMFNGLVINPAYAGSSEVFNASALYRKQWVNVIGAPETYALAMDIPVYSKKVGLGLNLYNDRLGILNNFAANGIYSYRIILPKGALSMGIQAGVTQINADFRSARLNSSNSADNAFAEMLNQWMFNVGTGIYYYTEEFYIGLSSPHLINNNFRSDFAEQAYSHNPHYFLNTGYIFKLSDELKFKPSTLVKVVAGSPVQVDINSNIYFYDLVGLGVSYRSGESLVSIFELQASRQFRFGYAYDYPLNQIKTFTSGSHEVMLRYFLHLKNTKIITPRFF